MITKQCHVGHVTATTCDAPCPHTIVLCHSAWDMADLRQYGLPSSVVF